MPTASIDSKYSLKFHTRQLNKSVLSNRICTKVAFGLQFCFGVCWLWKKAFILLFFKPNEKENQFHSEMLLPGTFILNCISLSIPSCFSEQAFYVK